MLNTSNIEIVAALYDAFARRDWVVILQFTHPQIAVSQTEQLPWGGQFEGAGGLQLFFSKLLAHIDSRVEVEEYIEAGDRVVAIGRTRGRVNANGAEFDIRAVHVWTLQDSLAVRFEPYIDMPKMLAALQGQ